MSRFTPVSDDFDLILAAWFESDAPVPEPETLFDNVIEATSRTRPLPAWRLPERWIPVDLALRPALPRQRLAPILLVILLTIAVVAAAMIIGSQRQPKLPPPFGLAANGQIAFTVDGNLTLANPDGTDMTRVFSDTPPQLTPQFSNDGTRIVYLDSLGRTVDTIFGRAEVVDVTVANADGSNPVVVAHEVVVGNPHWSPDGRWITYNDQDAHVFVAPSDGSAPASDLGDFDGKGAWTPTFSPDSQKLAVSVFDGTLWIMDRDGSNPRQVSQDYPEVGGKGASASWHPDGTKLVFRAGEPGTRGDLYVVGLDGQPEVRIAADAECAVWSPDGNRIAWIQGGGLGQGTRVVVGSADPDKGPRILDGFYGTYVPAWSPDQTRIAILDDRPGSDNAEGGAPVIVMLDPDGIKPPITIPAGSAAPNEDYTLTWQRLAP